MKKKKTDQIVISYYKDDKEINTVVVKRIGKRKK